MSSKHKKVSANDTPVKSQDFHTQITTILNHSNFLDVMESGFNWKLNYKGNMHEVSFVLFCPFIKGDTQEHDKHCGRYLSRTMKVAQICRYCHCPTMDADNPVASYPKKLQEDIQQLVANRHHKKLQTLSQQIIDNAWYSVRFGQHNAMCVHGACPVEMLHALLLGLYKYAQKMFFSLVGKDSAAAQTLNNIAKQYGSFFRHHSDRDLPRTNFSKGILKGKLMAKEYSGLLLILLVVLRSKKGSAVLKNKKNFKKGEILDWTMLLELLLGWECWLKQDRIPLDEVKRARKKHRYLLALFRAIGRRKEGMQFKLFKFHAVLHIVEDILNFGVPMVVDTGANEGHHKVSKTAAKQTQKNAKRFEYQTALRCTDFLAVDLAICEIESNKRVFDYFSPSTSLAPEEHLEETNQDEESDDESDESGNGGHEEDTLVDISNEDTRFLLTLVKGTDNTPNTTLTNPTGVGASSGNQ